MQIMTGRERLQAEKCFRMLYFPFSHLTCLHTHNCLRRHKTCFFGVASMSRHHWDSTLWKVGNFKRWNFAAVAAGVSSRGWRNQQHGLIIPMRIFAGFKIYFILHLRYLAWTAVALQCYKRNCALDDLASDEF